MKELIAYIILGMVFSLIVGVFLVCYALRNNYKDEKEDLRDETKYRHWHED